MLDHLYQYDQEAFKYISSKILSNDEKEYAINYSKKYFVNNYGVNIKTLISIAYESGIDYLKKKLSDNDKEENLISISYNIKLYEVNNNENNKINNLMSLSSYKEEKLKIKFQNGIKTIIQYWNIKTQELILEELYIDNIINQINWKQLWNNIYTDEIEKYAYIQIINNEYGDISYDKIGLYKDKCIHNPNLI